MRADSEPRGGHVDVVYVLCLMQAAFVMLAGLGEVLLMGGSPGYLVLPLAKAVLLIAFAAKVVRGRRWAMLALVVLQSVTVTGFWIQVAAGALPWVDFTVNLVDLMTNLVLPVTLIYLCVTMYSRATAANRLAAAGTGEVVR